MTAQQLLAAVDRMPYGQRTAHAAAEARRLRGTVELREMLAALAVGEAFHRRLGLFMAGVAGEPAHVEAALSDPEPAVQGLAVSVAARMPAVDDAALARLYEDAPAWLRRVLVREIRVGGRHALTAALVGVARERWGDDEAVRLLSGCRGEQLADHLDELAHLLTPGGWTRLAVVHPTAVLDHAERVLPELPTGPAVVDWWDSAGWGVTAAARELPRRALAVVERWLPADVLPGAVRQSLGRLVDADARAVARVLLAPERHHAVTSGGLAPGVLRRAHRFTDDELAALGRRLWPVPGHVAALLDALSPSRRAGVFERVTATLDLSQAVLPDVLLDVLPHAVRHAHARRMLPLREVRDVPAERWRVAGQLPFDEAFELLDAEVRRSDADERAAVYRALVASAGRSRDRTVVARLLGWLARLRNEQDPVRRAALQAVAELPPSTVDPAHVAALDTLLGDALDARDRSWATDRAVEAIAQTAVLQGALRDEPRLLEWGLASHERISGVADSPQLWSLADGLPRGREHQLYAAFRPHVDAAARRGTYGLAFTLARRLGRRGWDVAHLQQTLERALHADEEHVVGTAVELWLADPRRRSDRVGVLFGRDGRITRRANALLGRGVTFARSPAVWQAISEQRTDLLDRIFRDPTPSLRFRDLNAWYVRPSAFLRWLPRQHRRYAELLAEVAADADQPSWTRAVAVRTLGAVPGFGRGALQPFLTSPDTVLREAALGALAWTDRPDVALPQLLSLAGADDARVAVYAATRAARFVRPSRLTEMLRPVLVEPGRKVTARKEAARLLGELRAPDAVATFTVAWPDAHRDVRAAMTSALAHHLLDDEDAWPLLASAVRGDSAEARVVAGALPGQVAVRHRRRYGRLVVDACEHGDVDVVALALRVLAWWAPWVPDAVPTCVRWLVDLDAPRRCWSQASATLARFARTGTGVDAVVGAVRTLVATEESGATPDAAADRDRPARRRADALVRAVTGTVTGADRTVMREVCLAVAAALEPSASFLPSVVRLRTHAVDWTQPREDLFALATLLADRPVEALHAASALAAAMDATQQHWTTDTLEPLPADLAASGVPGGLLAVTVTDRCGSRRNWPDAWRARLRALRTHPDPDVRQAALAVATAGE